MSRKQNGYKILRKMILKEFADEHLSNQLQEVKANSDKVSDNLDELKPDMSI